ncbi:TetR/AcrR family transcriptional regulator [Amycolatopsis panacis]|uniref:TetR/AcrR family transcriptional regulator n=1 Tax=Amycolatopsis panacis TaxID=2340917 RepID=A0A419I595_9PSEU|nr:TetR/AcrR family transcriptional regulator [Amycolatopsis panacis]RJQ85869.1 TetR/AcrR family transcriptional regulator [Amycolatopsis panacis]
MSEEGPPRRRRADAERNRTRLLEAGRAAFASGREPVTLERIARDAGVGIGTLYRHFPTREAFVEALYREEVAQLCASAEVLLAAENPVHALRRWMDRFAEYATAKREMADSLRVLLSSGAVAITDVREDLTAAVQTILDAGISDGTLRADVRAEDIVVSVVGMTSATAVDGGREQLDRMFDLLLDGVRR